MWISGVAGYGECRHRILPITYVDTRQRPRRAGPSVFCWRRPFRSDSGARTEARWILGACYASQQSWVHWSRHQLALCIEDTAADECIPRRIQRGQGTFTAHQAETSIINLNEYCIHFYTSVLRRHKNSIISSKIFVNPLLTLVHSLRGYIEVLYKFGDTYIFIG